MFTFELDDNVKSEIESFKIALEKSTDSVELLRSGFFSDSLQAMGEKILLAAEADPTLMLPLDAWGILGAATVLDPAAANVEAGLADAVRSGAKRISFAVNEEGAGDDWEALASVAEGEGSACKISGTKTWITGAADADGFVVLAREGGSGGKLATYLTTDLDHSTVTPIEAEGGLRAGKVTLEGAAAVRLGSIDLVTRAVVRGRIAITYGAAGIIKKLRALATEHAINRQSGGKALVHKQSIHFKIAEIKVMEEGCYRTAQRIARVFDVGDTDAGTMAKAGKLFASEGIRKSLDWAIEIQGASAFTGEQGVAKYLPLVHTWSSLEGSDDLLKGEIADEVLRATGSYEY